MILSPEKMKVKLIGYPDSDIGYTPTIITTTMISYLKDFYMASLFTVAYTIQHGMSGGLTLNSIGQVIGLIKAGLSTMEDQKLKKMWFIPIDYIIEDIQYADK